MPPKVDPNDVMPELLHKLDALGKKLDHIGLELGALSNLEETMHNLGCLFVAAVQGQLTTDELMRRYEELRQKLNDKK